MRFHALATDYDGTIARDGVVDDETIFALERLRASGRRLIMVTGRELDDLIRVCPRLDLFDLVVAENGAILYEPGTKLEAVLSGGPSLDLVNRLKAAGEPDVSVGRSIIALWKPHEVEALEGIRDLGLELHIVCPSSDDLRLFRRLRNGGSGSSGFEVMRPAADAASVSAGWSVA